MSEITNKADEPSPVKTCRYCGEPVTTMRDLIDHHTPCPSQGGRAALPVLDDLVDNLHR